MDENPRPSPALCWKGGEYFLGLSKGLEKHGTYLAGLRTWLPFPGGAFRSPCCEPGARSETTAMATNDNSFAALELTRLRPAGHHPVTPDDRTPSRTSAPAETAAPSSWGSSRWGALAALARSSWEPQTHRSPPGPFRPGWVGQPTGRTHQPLLHRGAQAPQASREVEWGAREQTPGGTRPAWGVPGSRQPRAPNPQGPRA
ncbi:uncharacterized protein LOC119517191 [Choloepus didactylus]|uniref:uncharacterized protein LOC119517191 n=1 Tax=Choloepus didactylus TaxID=27675 RepID=UPI0018A050B5|nr:uncharacterized protein LOC119517191 [Choloepus didactylus]